VAGEGAPTTDSCRAQAGTSGANAHAQAHIEHTRAIRRLLRRSFHCCRHTQSSQTRGALSVKRDRAQFGKQAAVAQRERRRLVEAHHALMSAFLNACLHQACQPVPSPS
jgi:hypothetical protein